LAPSLTSGEIETYSGTWSSTLDIVLEADSFSAALDLPLAVSPVVVGLALILVYGRFSPVGGWLDERGVQIIFSTPGMVLATVFVSLPLVVRAVEPVLAEMGVEQEHAAHTLGASGMQTFRRITIPGIRAAFSCRLHSAIIRAA